MAYPTVINSLTQEFNTANTNTFNVNMPATVNSGDLLILFFSTGKYPTYDIQGAPAGWTEMYNALSSNISDAVFYKTADGSEGGTSVTITTSQNQEVASALVYRITNWQSIEWGVAVNQSDGDPNPPALTASWGAGENLWIAHAFWGSGGYTASGFPSGYSNPIQVQGDGGGTNSFAMIGACQRELNVASENPGVFTLTSDFEQWVANTIVVRGVQLDSTAPTFTTDGTLTEANNNMNSVDLQFDKSQDETTAQAALVYRLWRASQGTDISTVANINANGTEITSGTDVTSLTDATPTTGETYEYNVTAEDEAGNRLAYTQLQVTLDTLKGEVTMDGAAVAGAIVVARSGDDLNVQNSVEVGFFTTDAQGNYRIVGYDPTKNYFLSVFYRAIELSGTAESGSANTLTDTDLAMTTDQYSNYFLVQGGEERKVISNTADTFTVEHDWDVPPGAGTAYELVINKSDESEIIPNKQ